MRGFLKSHVPATLSRIQNAFAPYRDILVTLVVATCVGMLLAAIASRIQPEERILVGNTSGTLTTIIELETARIMVGAGPSRSHSADLLGRTTRPWDRQVDLLILPGWDDRHTAGAIGLLERQAVEGIAVIGLPGEEPMWSMLEREAEQSDVPIVFIDRSSELPLDENTLLQLSSSSRDGEGAYVRLEHYGKRIDMLDSANTHGAAPDPATMDRSNEHVYINTRAQSAPDAARPELMLLPRPHWQGDFTERDTPYRIEIERNQHVSLRLNETELRVPLDDVTIRRD